MLRPERNRWLLITVGMALLAVLAGCADDSSPSSSQGTAYGTLTTYMADNSLDLPNVLDGWIVAASAVTGNEGDYHIMDIRSAADYATGHIEGAVSSIDVAIYDFNRASVRDRLIAAHGRGVVVRVVTDDDSYEDDSYHPFYAALVSQ